MPRTDTITVPFDAEDNLTPKTSKIKETIQNIGIVIGSMVTTAKLITSAMDEVSAAILKKPELFTEEEVRRAENYAAASEDLSQSLNKLAVEVMPIVSVNLQALADIPGAIEAIKNHDLSGYAANIMNNALGIKSASEEAGNAILELGKKQISMMEQLSGASDEQTAKIIYNNLLQKLSMDGITEAEFEMATQAGIALGIFDEKTAAVSMTINEMTDKVIAGKIAVEDLGNAINLLKDRSITVSVSSTGTGLNLLESSDGTRVRVGIRDRRAAGGPVSAGQSYLVGEQGPELFSPGTSGVITPNNQTGGIDYDKLTRAIVQALQKGQQ